MNPKKIDYIMTYGWAILIIIVVMGALYQMGVFDEAQEPQKLYPEIDIGFECPEFLEWENVTYKINCMLLVSK